MSTEKERMTASLLDAEDRICELEVEIAALKKRLEAYEGDNRIRLLRKLMEPSNGAGDISVSGSEIGEKDG